MEELSAVASLQLILDSALVESASDVHLHLSGHELIVNFRISGMMQPKFHVYEDGDEIIRRIKALARMDTVECRIPQDGAFVWSSGATKCDVRVATLPIIDGESIVLRLLGYHQLYIDFTSLGMTNLQAETVKHLLSNSAGMILVAGPTGAGKTTTLYTMMSYLASELGRHVMSIEDPVESQLTHCRQMEVREQVGITFDLGLRSMLRQDPDVIMIGEIRDEETAKIALRAALSGRMVLSTTHAGDVIGAATRLVDFGLSRSLVGDVLSSVIVQRLVGGQVCKNCSGRTCSVCQGTGFLDERHAQFEISPMTHHLKSLLSSEMTWTDLRNYTNTPFVSSKYVMSVKDAL